KKFEKGLGENRQGRGGHEEAQELRGLGEGEAQKTKSQAREQEEHRTVLRIEHNLFPFELFLERVFSQIWQGPQPEADESERAPLPVGVATLIAEKLGHQIGIIPAMVEGEHTQQ